MEDQLKKAVRNFASEINSGITVSPNMSELVSLTSELPLSGFDYWERLIRNEYYFARKDAAIPSYNLWSKPNDVLTWLDIVSWDGHKREKAIRTLSGAALNSFFLSFAIRRLNDWVPQVRKAAREKLPEIARETTPEIVAEALCSVLSNWSTWGRIEEADKKVLLQIMCNEKIAKALSKKLISSTCGPMPSLFSQFGRTQILDEYIEDIASKAIQPSVRAKAYRALFERRVIWTEGRKWVWTDKRYCEGRMEPIVVERELNVNASVLDLLIRSSVDRSSIVRRISAEFVIRELTSLGVDGVKLAEKFSLDLSSTVSERGRFALKKLREMKVTGEN